MPLAESKPFWQTTDREYVRLYQGDVLDVLERLPSRSVHCIVTSPPYWGLRDYGTGTWEGGDAGCNHINNGACRTRRPHSGGVGNTSLEESERLRGEGEQMCVMANSTQQYLLECGKCGAVRLDRQLGSESVPDCLGWARGVNCAEASWQDGCHVCRMVMVCRELRRVLRDDGVFWLNYGDSYASSGGHTKQGENSQRHGRANVDTQNAAGKRNTSGLLSGNLTGVPWRVALALQADGWTLRQDMVWHKTSPMPESVRSRCTKSHEYIFMLAKGNRYYYDADAIKEVAVRAGDIPGGSVKTVLTPVPRPGIHMEMKDHSVKPVSDMRNKRSVWAVASQPYAGAHYACFPEKLVEPCVLAGTSEYGACAGCGAPWRRLTNVSQVMLSRASASGKLNLGVYREVGAAAKCGGIETVEAERIRTVRTYVPDPDCLLDEHPVVPCVVLDPFVGSGTTCVVALENGRRSIGIDLSEKYLTRNAIPRIEGALLAIPSLAGLVPVRGNVVKVLPSVRPPLPLRGNPVQ